MLVPTNGGVLYKRYLIKENNVFLAGCTGCAPWLAQASACAL